MSWMTFATTLIFAITSQGAFLGGPRVVKLLDGRSAKCESQNHVAQPAYYLASADVSPSGSSSLSISIPVAFVTCSEISPTKYGWTERHPFELVPSRDLLGRRVYSVATEQVFVILSRRDQIVGTQAFTSAPVQTAKFEVSVEQILSDNEILDLERGQIINAQFLFYSRGIYSVIDAEGKEIPLGLRTTGAFTILFTLEKEDGRGLVVNQVKLKSP